MLVAPEHRVFALSIIIGGLTTATAFGSPLGSMIGSLGDWRWTMVFVAGLGSAASFGILFLLSDIPMPPAVRLGKRVAPLADARIVLTLATTLLAIGGVFTVYTYFSVVFDRALGTNPIMLGVLLSIFGAAGTLGNLTAGRFVDRLGARKVLVVTIIMTATDISLLPWTGANLWVAVPAIMIWGIFSWSIQAPQQSRLVSMAPNAAPVVLALKDTGTYLGVTLAGVIGALGIHTFGAHSLGIVGALLVLLGLVACELATARITTANRIRVVMA